MRRPCYYILTGLFSLVASLVQLLRPASRGRGRGLPSSGIVSKAKATKGNQNKVMPRPKRRKVAVAAAAKEHPESRKVAAAEEPRIREGELDVYERMRLSGQSLLETHRLVCMKLGPIPVKLEPDRVYSYSIVARVPKSVIQKYVRPRDWYESFIPKVGDDTPPWKKPCLRDLTYNGFNAMLSPRQVEWMQKKMPGFRSAHPRLLFIQ